jgi:hypothetical protein
LQISCLSLSNETGKEYNRLEIRMEDGNGYWEHGEITGGKGSREMIHVLGRSILELKN